MFIYMKQTLQTVAAEEAARVKYYICFLEKKFVSKSIKITFHLIFSIRL